MFASEHLDLATVVHVRLIRQATQPYCAIDFAGVDCSPRLQLAVKRQQNRSGLFSHFRFADHRQLIAAAKYLNAKLVFHLRKIAVVFAA